MVSNLAEEASARMNEERVKDLQLCKLKSKCSVFKMVILLFANRNPAVERTLYL